MAKQICTRWVNRKNNRWWRYLPRRNDGSMKFDYEGEGSLDAFTDKMNCRNPPKLWVAWLHRDFKKLPDTVRQLFGDDAKAGTMNVFKNTYSTNKALWKIKGSIELRPITFPNGEPTLDNVGNVEILYNGCCIIDSKFAPNPVGIQLLDPSKQFTRAYLGSRLMSRDKRYKDVYEDNVYNPSNITIID